MFKITHKHFKEYQLGVNDCWTLVQDIYRENSIELPAYVDVNSAKKRKDFKTFIIDNVEYTEVDKIARGVIILFDSNPYHCGVAVDSKNMIHRAENINTRVERIETYGKKIKGLYLVKKKNI